MRIRKKKKSRSKAQKIQKNIELTFPNLKYETLTKVEVLYRTANRQNKKKIPLSTYLGNTCIEQKRILNAENKNYKVIQKDRPI